jgi:hypothetical protein
MTISRGRSLARGAPVARARGRVAGHRGQHCHFLAHQSEEDILTCCRVKRARG